MGFFSSIVFYRPRKPPVITGAEVSRFLSDIQRLDCIAPSFFSHLKVKFGKSIDQDERPAAYVPPAKPGSVSIMSIEEIDWDLELERTELGAMVDALAADERTIYRMQACLGQGNEALLENLRREPSSENEVGFYPSDVSIEIGPIELHNLANADTLFVGWIGLKFAGNGYLYPWTVEDIIERVAENATVRSFISLARKQWPVQATKPNASVVALRELLQPIWPYRDLDRRWDWYWGADEG